MRLLRLEIEDFGLIERASLEFADGFTVCSGETGSGKTMLLGALAFALGERTSSDSVRNGAVRTRVTLAVEASLPLQNWLAASGFDADDDDATIFSREMSATGKSQARINGSLATAAQLRDAGDVILEQIGQHEQQRLLSRAYQRDVLDAFSGDAAMLRRSNVARAYERVRRAESDLASASDDDGRALAELEFARFALGEIDDAAVAAGEDDSLRARREYLANGERIAAALGAAHEALAGEGSALETTGAAAASLDAVARFSPELERVASALTGAQSELGEVAVAIARALENSEFDPTELESVTARLDRIDRLKKKYGGSIDAIANSRERFETTIARESTRDERQTALRAELVAARATLAADAVELSRLRASAAAALERAVAAELAGLAMPAARFAVMLEALEGIGPAGAESVEFALAPNPGEPVRSLVRAASGGELSRVLLALVVVLADRRERTALVFDEVDAGIGGATASAVGVRLAALARASQVICVTHLAQIASWADRHYALRKRERDGATVVELIELAGRGDVLAEIARMLSGTTAAVALDHAETLVRDARASKARAKRSA